MFSSLYGNRLDRELGSADASQLFTSARRKAAINEAHEEFAEITECLQRRVSIPLTGGTAEYDLNSTTVIPTGDFLRYAAVPPEFWYTDASGAVTVLTGDDLPRREVSWLQRFFPGWQTSTVASSAKQLPTCWYDRPDGGARNLGFAPVPSTGSSASIVAVVSYIARPTPMTSDTQEPFTVNSSARTDLRPYHQALVHFAACQLEKLRRDDAASDRQKQTFLGYITRWWAQTRPKGGRQTTYRRDYWQRHSNDRGVDPRV